MFLLDNNGKVISQSTIPYTVRSEGQFPSVVVVCQKWRIRLSIESSDIDHGLIISFLILQGWKLVLECFVDTQSPTCLDFINEVGISVTQYFDVEVDFIQFVEVRATSQNGSRNTHSILAVSLDPDGAASVSTIESTQETLGICTILEHPSDAPVHFTEGFVSI